VWGSGSVAAAVAAVPSQSQGRASKNKNKRKALQPLDPNVPSKRPATARNRPPHIQFETCPEPLVLPLPRPESRPQAPRLIPLIPESPPQPVQSAGFLPPDQWKLIQDFHTALDGVKMEFCTRCRERWFSMGLRGEICDACFLRDKGAQSPFLMSADNQMDPGEIPDHLPVLTQVEEMIIARSHVQMLVHRYRGHQYHYSGHCVSFMQNNIKTVDMLPNLPSELDIVVLRPSNQVMEDHPRYRSQI
jgi:hypothetical protein